MKAILTCIGFSVLTANLAAIVVGTRQGIGGMITIDALCVGAICGVAAIWLVRRMIGPARKSAEALSTRAEDAAVDIGARGLTLGRRMKSNAKGFADRVRARADEKLK
jgi:hypothetical protein